MPVTQGFFKPMRNEDSLVVQPPEPIQMDSLSLSSEDIELFTNTINIPLPLRDQPQLRLPEFGHDSILVKPPTNSNGSTLNNNWILLPSPGSLYCC